MPKQTRAGLRGRGEGGKKEVKNAAKGNDIILQQIPDLRVHTEVRQARRRTNKNSPPQKKKRLGLNKLCARTRVAVAR